jgi:hypothetical protein
VSRSLAKIKDQWTDLKSRLKKRTSAYFRSFSETGGGDVDLDLMDLSELEALFASFQRFELKVLKKLGNEWVRGIGDGIDTSDIQDGDKNQVRSTRRSMG